VALEYKCITENEELQIQMRETMFKQTALQINAQAVRGLCLLSPIFSQYNKKGQCLYL
jgi:hypothetical protein